MAHIVLGIIYSENEENIDELKSYSIEKLDEIMSVVRDITFLYKRNGELPLTGREVEILKI